LPPRAAASLPGAETGWDPLSSSAFSPARKFDAAGQKLWDSITSEYDISDSGGIALLCQICAAQDRIEQLAAQISTDGAVVRTKSGPKAHPTLRDELGNRAFVVRGLQTLGIALETLKPVGRPPGWSPIS
jgi:hypothetical protein